MMKQPKTLIILSLALGINAFSSSFVINPIHGNRIDHSIHHHARTTNDELICGDEKNDIQQSVSLLQRRSLLVNAANLIASTAVASISSKPCLAVDDDLTRGGVPLTPFNGLAFNYRGNDFNGLDASTIDEPTISYQDFLDKLDKEEVVFVEFMAPDGDVAYATFKTGTTEADSSSLTKPIRIGEGYPIEDHGGWSSPAFVVKIVKKKGVPYKFTVPGLAKYTNN
mmetsp:Transcript_5327/g.7766  ORF Transcript_5327/g.7766 Transcript_5327/m.7766 type:complete len:225 (+) Transcript_5327:56-730(+)